MSGLHYAPACRAPEHPPVAHHYRYEHVVGRPCQCPCHRLHNGANPWWRAVGAPEAPVTVTNDEPADS